MPNLRDFFSRWRKDYDFRTFVNSSGSLLATAAFALYNGFLGIYHASLWHGVICVYYLLLILIRGTLIFSERANARKTDPDRIARDRKRTVTGASVLLLFLNFSLVVPFELMVMQERPVSLTLIPAIAMATYTFYKITVASMNLKKKNKSDNPTVRLLRTINFVDALVSIAVLQNTLIMVNAGSDRGSMLTLTAITSGALWTAIMILSVSTLIKREKAK